MEANDAATETTEAARNHHLKLEIENVVTASGRLEAQQGNHEQVDRWMMV